MALHEFRCGRCEKTFERLSHGQALRGIECPACGWSAMRVVSAPAGFRTPEVDTRGMYRRFSEATAEIDHGASKIEASVGHPIETPNFYRKAQQKAKAMVAAGEAP